MQYFRMSPDKVRYGGLLQQGMTKMKSIKRSHIREVADRDYLLIYASPWENKNKFMKTQDAVSNT